VRAKGSQELVAFVLLAFGKILCCLSELKCNLFSLCEKHGKISGFKGKESKIRDRVAKKVSDFVSICVIMQS
jgi:hypothetical protein